MANIAKSVRDTNSEEVYESIYQSNTTVVEEPESKAMSKSYISPFQDCGFDSPWNTGSLMPCNPRYTAGAGDIHLSNKVGSVIL